MLRRPDLTVTPEMMDDIVRRIVDAFDPLQIILFGSRARGVDIKWDSDVDLLVVLEEVESKRQTAAAMLDLLADLTVPVDIVVTTPEEIARRGNALGSVLRPALREGKLLYAS
jgi:predicted nucleotidyltransferase